MSDLAELTSDSANARRLVRLFGGEMRYRNPPGEWLVWDGMRWALGDEGAVMRRALETATSIYHEANEIENDEKARARLRQHARTSESAYSLAAMLRVAQVLKPVCVKPDRFDRDPWLLNTLSGTLDLRTGAVREHRRGDYITNLAPVRYDPDAHDPVWDGFVRSVTRGDADLATFLQEAAGYSLTGDTREEALFFLFGPGASGKTLFLNAMRSILGDYARTAAFETFLAKRFGGGGATPELATLADARFVVASESDEGRSFAAATVKGVTGGEEISARALYKAPVEFTPRFKLWFSSNTRPHIPANDTGMWRRVRVIPFPDGHADNPDVALKAAIMAPEMRPAILAWAVRGCQAWAARGRLVAPAAVLKASTSYRNERDVLGQFLDDACERVAEAFEPSARLYAAYEAWVARNSGGTPLNEKLFQEGLSARDLPLERRRWRGGNPTRGRVGVRLNPEYALAANAREDSATTQEV